VDKYHNADELGRTLGKGRRWLVWNYEAGNVAFHNPYLVHGTCKNEDEQGRISLNTDLRFYGESAPLDKR
jgi:phytanoyl-CoA hydroxylase